MAAGRSKEMEIAIKIGGKVASSFKSAIGQATKGIGGIAKAVGAATTAAAAAVGAMGVAAINVGREFEGAMSQVTATMLLDKETTEGQKAFETLENAARECGASTAFSATQAAEALNYLALAGYDADAAATALPTVLKLAGAGAMELAQASDMVTDSMSALGIEATEENLQRFSDQMAKTASKANTSVPQLGEAILTVGGTAKDLAGGTTELNTALGILADNGIKAAEGGTHLRNMILSLQSARNGDAAALFEQMGLSAYDAEGNMRSLGEVFKDINNSLAGASADKVNSTLSTIFKQTDLASARAMLAATVDSVDALGAVMDASLAGSGTSLAALGINLQEMADNFDTAATQEAFAAQMMEQFGMTSEQAGTLFNGLKSVLDGTGNRFGELSAKIEDSFGACEDMYKKQQDNLNGDIASFTSALSNLGIGIYKDLSGPLRETTKLGTSMLGELSRAYGSGGMEGMSAAIGGCLAEALNVVAGYVPKAVSMGVGLLQSFMDGIVQNAGAVAGTVSSVLSVFVNGLLALVPQAILAGADIILQLAQGIAAQAPQLISAGVQAVSGLASGLASRLPEMVNVAIQLVNNLAQGIQEGLPKLIPAAMEALMHFSGALRENAGKLVDAGLGLIMALAQSLVDNIPVFIQTIPTIVTNIAGIINDNAPKLLSAGIQLILKLAAGIIQAVPVLIANIPQIIQSVVSVFTAFNWLALGSRIIAFIGNGIRAAITSIPQIFSNFVQNVHNIVSSVGWHSLGRGIITTIGNGISSLITSIPRIFLNIGNYAVSAIKSIDWWGVGTAILQLIGEAISGAGGFIIDAIKGIGGGIIDGIKGLFGGGSEEAEAAASGAGLAESYANGISSNKQEAAEAAKGLSAGIFDSVDLAGASMAGQETAASFMSGVAEGLGSGEQGMGLDSMALDVQGIESQFVAAGEAGGAAFSSGLEGSSQVIAQAAAALGTDVNTALDSGWNQAKTSAQSAMQEISSFVANAARAAAGAVKSAFENMSITIPKPRLPVIEVASNSVPYGDGGNVSIPKFSVKWNALGGIFNRPTIFGTPAGMQGVGEAGPEAVLPLDTLWAKMKDILSDAMAVNSGGSAVDALLEKLKGVSAGGGRLQPEPAGAGVPGIVWNPTYNLYGSAGKAEIAEANRIGMAEFRRLMKQYERDLQRSRL